MRQAARVCLLVLSAPVIWFASPPYRGYPAAKAQDVGQEPKGETKTPDVIFVPTPQEVVDKMSATVAIGDVAAMIDLDTEFHSCIVDAAGKHRLAALWRTLDAQMGALMRSSIDRQHIDLTEAVRRHQQVTDSFRTGSADDFIRTLEDHYLGTVDIMAEAGVLQSHSAPTTSSP